MHDGDMALEPSSISAPDLARELGHADGGKKLRGYLRRRYPDHFHGQRWLISKVQADDARRHFGAQKPADESAEPVTPTRLPIAAGVRTGARASRESRDPGELAADAIHTLSRERWAIADAAVHVPAASGLYAIYGDEQAWRDLQLDPTPDRPLYVGKAEDSLVSRDLDGHFAMDSNTKPRTGSSTVRRSFAALLRESLDLHAMPRNLAKPERFSNYALVEGGDGRLNEWMHARLALAVWPAPAGMSVPLSAVETAVIAHFSPPINIAKNPHKLARLGHARSVMAAEASQWTLQHDAAVERIVARQAVQPNAPYSEEDVRRAIAVVVAADVELLAKEIRTAGRVGRELLDKLRGIAGRVSADDRVSSAHTRR